MKKFMNRTISTLAALLFVASTTVVAQQSDYNVQQDFRADYSALVSDIDAAESSDEIASIVDQISELEAEYSGYSDLLDNALYPDTFEDRMEDLRNRVNVSRDNISVIEDLNERISELESEIEELRDQLSQLDEEATATSDRLERSAANERRLSGLVSQYRQNIEDRDAFVSEMLEDLLNRYEAMDAETQSEISDAAESLEDDPLALLETIISGYINQADRDSGLEASDYVQMRAQHGYFSTVWDRIGERMANSYASDRPVQAEQEITDLLATWESSVNNKLWGALSTAFNQNGVDLPEFTSDDAFNSALNSFVDQATETAREQNEEADFELYTSFNDYWNNTVKAQWGEHLVAGNVLSQSDIAAIDVKLSGWGQNAATTSNLMFILFLISIAVIIGLIVLLVTKKS
ncbi:MAG: hypothetical protein WEA58_00495 [Balneolaceae bacterium]